MCSNSKLSVNACLHMRQYVALVQIQYAALLSKLGSSRHFFGSIVSHLGQGVTLAITGTYALSIHLPLYLTRHSPLNGSSPLKCENLSYFI